MIMNYNEINLNGHNFDKKFVKFINSYQNKYKVLDNTISPEIKNIKANTSSKIQDIKSILEDFFFSPRYDNALDLIKFGND